LVIFLLDLFQNFSVGSHSTTPNSSGVDVSVSSSGDGNSSILDDTGLPPSSLWFNAEEASGILLLPVQSDSPRESAASSSGEHLAHPSSSSRRFSAFAGAGSNFAEHQKHAHQQPHRTSVRRSIMLGSASPLHSAPPSSSPTPTLSAAASSASQEDSGKENFMASPPLQRHLSIKAMIAESTDDKDTLSVQFPRVHSLSYTQ
jgi:hypothetical protein